MQRKGGVKNQNIWEFVNNCTVAIQNGKGKIWQEHQEQKEQEFMEVSVGLLLNFLCCINCSNVKRLKNPPNFTQRRQIRKAGGNPNDPKYTYWTLHLKQKEGEPTEAKAGHGGKSGPRLHLRRGHFRRLQSGKFVWVNYCMVGSAEKGVALKDYSIH